MPDDDLTHFNLANLLANTPGRETEAIPLYEAVLKHRPDSHETHTNLANVLAKTGRPNDAKLHWQRALELKPDFEPAKHGMQWLEQNQRR
jgi:tetratricopeptide (TPR) repeat protein